MATDIKLPARPTPRCFVVPNMACYGIKD